MTTPGHAVDNKRPIDDRRVIARHQKTQRIRINSAMSMPIVACLIAVPMLHDDAAKWRVALWLGPWMLSAGMALSAAWQRRGHRVGGHRFDRIHRVPASIATLGLPFLVGVPTWLPMGREILLIALVASSSLLSLVGLQYRRRRQLWVTTISGLGIWFAFVLVISDRVSYGVFSALWTTNLCLVIISALNSRDDLAEISDDHLRMSRLDGLTGALNREGLLARWREMRDDEPESTLLLVDLDRFKDINDRWGHLVGDNLLVEATRRLYETVGSIGTVARLGGDKFGTLMRGSVDSPAVKAAIDDVVEAFDQAFLVNGKTMHVDASVGVVAMRPDDEIAVALTNADYALFDSKARPKGSVSVFDPEMRAALDRRRDLEAALPSAIENDEFQWWGQPILSTRTLQPVGVELLCRWKHDGEYQNPTEFLEIMADLRLLNELGRKNLDFAALWLERWREDKELADVGINVNLTPQHLLTTAVNDIERAVPREDRNRLGVELVETEVIPKGEGLRGQAETLRQMGCRLILDDFGAGYSALSVLSDLRVSTIKIDRSLVSGLHNDERKTKLVEAASQIGVTLGTSTVCEGVETEDELNAIRRIGIPLVQGWLFSKALPMNECDVLLRRLSRAAREDCVESFEEVREAHSGLPSLV